MHLLMWVLNHELKLSKKEINKENVVDSLELARGNFQALQTHLMLYVKGLISIYQNETNTMHY